MKLPLMLRSLLTVWLDEKHVTSKETQEVIHLCKYSVPNIGQTTKGDSGVKM
jgi:hypothetical protein